MWPSGQVTHYNIPTGQVTHYNVTIWVGNPLQYTIWAGNPLQCDHFWKILVFFQTSGRSPRTIRPLAKFFAFFYHRAGCPKQFHPLKKKNKNKKNKQKQKKWVIVRMICFLISTSLCKSHMSISCFQSFQKKKKKQKFCLYLLFFINLLHKDKGKWNFPNIFA
jgi:hypothetical protein